MADLFNLNAEETLNVFEAKKRAEDGLFRPDVKDGDPERGYIAKFRFLPNFTKDETVGESAIEKLTHYIKIEGHDEVNGALDCAKNHDPKCPICDLYWKLRNSKSVVDNAKAETINRNVQYYSYIYVIEDEFNPENVGKIMIWQYGKKIADKIKEEKMGMYGPKCNVFDLAEGKDFLMVLKKVGDWNNYDSSKFLEQGPLTLISKDGKKKAMPTEESNGRQVIAEKVRDKVKDFLLKRDHDIENFAPKAWGDEEVERANRIVQILSGVNGDASVAQGRVNQAADPTLVAQPKKDKVTETVGVADSNDDDSDEFFDDFDDI
jgi:hypothetical protein